MDIEFVLPASLGEWLAWLTAAMTMLVGLLLMFVPQKMLSADGLQLISGDKTGLSVTRGAFGGVYAGLGLAVLMLHPQPLLYFALGLAFVGALIGRAISFVIDRARGGVVVTGTIAEILGAFFPIAYVFGIIP